MNKRLRLILTILFALVFVGSLGGFLWNELDRQRGQEAYNEAQDLAEMPDFSALPPPTLDPLPEDGENVEEEEGEEEPKPAYVDPYAELLRNMDFSALREINPDVLGWILVPGTNISYPLLQGRDNDQYLRHTWRGNYSVVGSIFLECNNSPGLSDFNTIVYGHRMRNGSMFGSLKYFKNLSYWKSHPCVYITDDNGSHKYNIFAAYEASVSSTTYRLSFPNDAAKQEYIDWGLSQSVIDTGLVPTVSDQILTLSTCTGQGHANRWVVQAYKPGPVRPEEAVPPSAPVEGAPSPEETGQPDPSQPEETVPPSVPVEDAPSPEETGQPDLSQPAETASPSASVEGAPSLEETGEPDPSQPEETASPSAPVEDATSPEEAGQTGGGALSGESPPDGENPAG